jgi:hypothetical protein
MRSTASWWGHKARRFAGHLRARVSASERSALDGWLSPAQLGLFDSMHIADRRHGLDVAAALREQGITDPDALLAGLLHDTGKGRTGVWPRVAYSLGQAYGTWVWSLAGAVPGFRAPLDRLRHHPERSAGLATAAGCSQRTVELIRHQDDPVDPEFGEILRLADESN